MSPHAPDAPEFIRVWRGRGFEIIVSVVEPDRGEARRVEADTVVVKPL